MKKIVIALISTFILIMPIYSQDLSKGIQQLLKQQEEKSVITKKLTVYLNKEIGEPELYTDLIALLNNATKEQTITFKINSPGGDVLSTLDIINAMKRSKAYLIADVQFAASAASWIALSCDKVIVEKYAIMMIHSMRGGLSGTPLETLKQSDVFNRLNEDLIRNIYKNFLSKVEMEKVMNGAVIWLYEDEIVRRLNK